MSTDPKATVREFLDAVNRQDWDRWAELLAPDLSYTVQGRDLPGGGVPLDREGALKMVPGMIALFAEGGPTLEITHIIAEGDWVFVEATGHGSFHDGTPYDNRYANVYEVVDGRIRTQREYMDTPYMAGLLATVAPPA
ncbi:nuclear transport factor 2 family protein [Streptomyces sp. NPDC047081]|uniref:nuclear transport factor 2 family protein n=1 Tax=Streptomyces sp. NPDC047081 TaxID=3154706 RepID=UPI0034030183